MNKTDKETLLDNFITLKELLEETKSILYMEASPKVYQQARQTWLEDMEMALGDKRQINPFQSSFWITLLELGLLDQQGAVQELTDDEDQEEEEDNTKLVGMTYDTPTAHSVEQAVANKWSGVFQASKEQDNEELEDDEPYTETQYDLDPNPVSDPSVSLSNAELVEEPVAKETKPLISLSLTSFYTHQSCQGIFSFDGDKEYLVNGKAHRIDGPAIERKNGDKYWYQEGLLHRIGGPAIDLVSGHKEWWVSGKLHRWDGSAIEHAEGITGKGYALYNHIFESKREWESAKLVYALKSMETPLPALPPAPTKPKLPVIYG